MRCSQYSHLLQQRQDRQPTVDWHRSEIELDNVNGRGYSLLGDLGTTPNVIYLKKVDKEAEEEEQHG